MNYSHMGVRMLCSWMYNSAENMKFPLSSKSSLAFSASQTNEDFPRRIILNIVLFYAYI